MTITKILDPIISPTNVWELNLTWMSGDADHYEQKSYCFATEEEFKKAYEFALLMTKAYRWYSPTKAPTPLGYTVLRNMYYDNLDKLEAKQKYDKSGPYYSAEEIAAAKEILGEHKHLSSAFEAVLHDSTPYDITCEDYTARLTSIEPCYYYDETGARFKLQITE